jgi:hypothetical protein
MQLQLVFITIACYPSCICIYLYIGKGTNCARIVKDFGYVHLSAGDLLREERDSGSENGNMIDQMIKDGKIVPADVTIKLLIAAMEKSGASKFLIDGFPRNHNNLTRWNVSYNHIELSVFIIYMLCLHVSVCAFACVCVYVCPSRTSNRHARRVYGYVGICASICLYSMNKNRCIRLFESYDLF